MIVSPTSRMGSWYGQLFAGLFVAAAVFMAGQGLLWVYRTMVPISTVFTASVAVPDFIRGDDPLTVYDRDIKTDFLGNFTVEVKGVTEGASYCVGGLEGVTYGAGEVSDPKITTLSWYVGPIRTGGAACLTNLAPGQYYLETNYTIHVDNWPQRTLRTESNVFSVLAPK